MDDLRERVKHDENAFQKLAERIPGFEGYHQQEIRRSADKLLREHLVRLLDQIRQRLQRFREELQARAEFKPVMDLDRLGRRLVRARDRIEHASYGYAGFLDAVKIEAAALDRLYDYDLALEQNMAGIDAAAQSLIAAEPGQYEAAIGALGDALEELSRMLDLRSETAAELAP